MLVARGVGWSHHQLLIRDKRQFSGGQLAWHRIWHCGCLLGCRYGRCRWWRWLLLLWLLLLLLLLMLLLLLRLLELTWLLLLPGVALAAALALGAVVAPPDAIAASRSVEPVLLACLAMAAALS